MLLQQDSLSFSATAQISASELAEAHIDQIERLNPELNALVDFDAERVRAQARQLDAMREPRGPLHGLPVTIKSSIATAGYRCEIGSTLRKGDVPKEDAVVVARLRAAGALILGTTNCPEFLMAYETANLLHGRTCNPWDLERSPGGSSGGESAAIAAGLSAAGLGSDSGGSVRQPAHFTGICSLKPTPGRIPGRGHMPPCVGPFAILGAIGPMARTVGDLELLFDVLAGQDVVDPVSPPIALRKPSLDDVRQLTVGYFEDDGWFRSLRKPARRYSPQHRLCARRASALNHSARHSWNSSESSGLRFLSSAERFSMNRKFRASTPS